MHATQIFAVRAGLAKLFTAALDATDFIVFDGPMTHSQVPKHFVTVGTDGGEDGTGQGSVDTSIATLVRSQYSATGGRDEAASVTCGVWRWAGAAKDLPKCRTEAESALDLCVDAVTADPTLDGVLDRNDDGAYASGVRVTEQQTTAGPFVRVSFDITYGALLV